MPLLSLEILVTCITYFKSIHPRSETPPLPRTLPLIIHTKKCPSSLLCTKALSADWYYSPTTDNTMVDCLYARLSQWTVSCFIHLCVLRTYQDQARGWHALKSHWTEYNRKFPIHSMYLWVWTSQSLMLQHVLLHEMAKASSKHSVNSVLREAYGEKTF